MKNLYLHGTGRLVSCYETGEIMNDAHYNSIELYASSSCYKDIPTTYYIDTDLDGRYVQKLGKFNTFDEAKAEFESYMAGWNSALMELDAEE